MRRLRKWASELGLTSYGFVNAVPTTGKVNVSMVDFPLLTSHCSSYDRVVALGNFASKCLRKADVDHFKLPHPSGLNRLLNNPEFELLQLHNCKEYIR